MKNLFFISVLLFSVSWIPPKNNPGNDNCAGKFELEHSGKTHQIINQGPLVQKFLGYYEYKNANEGDGYLELMENGKGKRKGDDSAWTGKSDVKPVENWGLKLDDDCTLKKYDYPQSENVHKHIIFYKIQGSEWKATYMYVNTKENKVFYGPYGLVKKR